MEDKICLPIYPTHPTKYAPPMCPAYFLNSKSVLNREGGEGKGAEPTLSVRNTVKQSNEMTYNLGNFHAEFHPWLLPEGSSDSDSHEVW